MALKKHFLLLLYLSILPQVLTSGDVYLVIGSDTAIWDGMSTSRFHNFYNIDLYINPMGNAYQVMNPDFRARLVDSDGQPLKLTWWMMAGNIFRYATNKNVPIPNIMTLYLMKKYHGQNVRANSDELSLHYHTFIWSDYNKDGQFYWNQAPNFNTSKEDFDFTLAQFLLEEQVFPVSFRSGWHYMDNDWQAYLDNFILPYSFHNDYPAKHTDLQEPIDNNYDWSQAPSTFVPYRPSPQNYQLPGNGRGWNVRSAHFWRVIYQGLMDTVFSAAQNGKDQVACFWGHLPEKDFVSNLQAIDSIAHACEKKYPGVRFFYCTATEAMQRWRKLTDISPPQVTLNETASGEQLYFLIETDRPIFQKQPFVAVKDIYEDYKKLECTSVGSNAWQTVTPIDRNQVAKVGVAVCDSLGNQTLKFLNYLPDDVYLDNTDDAYSESAGVWQSVEQGIPFGVNARVADLDQDTTASAQWHYQLEQDAFYNLFVQIPEIENRARQVEYVIFLNDVAVDTLLLHDGLPANEWFYLATLNARNGDQLKVVLQATTTDFQGKVLVADVLKISALVRQRDLRLSDNSINFGSVGQDDTVRFDLKLQNLGREFLTIKGIQTTSKRVFTNQTFPMQIPAMSSTVLPVFFSSTQRGQFSDTLTIVSNDPRHPLLSIPISADVQNYLQIIDNEDTLRYREFGQWYYSVAQAYGGTSRYTWLNKTPRPYARFFTTLKKNGVYEIFEIVPKTENATDRALYEIRVNDVAKDSIFLDQNEGSGNWVSLGLHYLPANVKVEVRVIDSGQSTRGAVLRADAVKFQLVREITDLPEGTDLTARQFKLDQNFPNPFNLQTTIRYHLPKTAHVRLVVFNVLGETVTALYEGVQSAGEHRLTWEGKDDNGRLVSSGIYYYRLEYGGKSLMRKMILLK